MKLTCPYCQEIVFPWQLTVFVEEENWHYECRLKEEDDIFFDRDMGFGD
jgi:hypothetical protein